MSDTRQQPAATSSSGRRSAATKRSRVQRAGESAFGALLLVRLIVLGLVALLVLAGGVWASWQTAPDAMVAEGRERGTMTLRECDDEACTGPFEPSSADGTARDLVVLAQPIGREEGEALAVALRPGTDEAVRTGLPGILYAWLPLDGALLLAAIVIAGGLRMYRTAWATAGLGVAALAVTFAVW
jgi:hypothetical protein